MRLLPIGAEIVSEGVFFRVWAPKCQKVEVVVDEKYTQELLSENNGYFSGTLHKVHEGMIYQYRLDGKGAFPDPASRFQPAGPHGPSQIIDYKRFKWSDGAWEGVFHKERVILYEMHVGTFTQEGTWRSALQKLSYLADLGINVIEMMPIAEWPGRFNWGYDGVNLFAPTHNYGTPDDLRAFINEAHRLGIAVILDVVYNHFGPDGNYLMQFSDDYLRKEPTEWGNAINFKNKEVRSYFIENATYWIQEFHFDGLRFDACHAIEDDSPVHILKEITHEVRKRAKGRSLFITAENEREEIWLAQDEKAGGYGLDAVWNEDFHHTAIVRLTGHNEGYFNDYLGKPQEFISSIKYGFLYQGQKYSRGSPSLNEPAQSLINFIENHDQVANLAKSKRLFQVTDPASYRVMTTLLLTAPQIPLLFQGQEFGSQSPFHFFADHSPELAEEVLAGRIEFISQFERFKDGAIKKPHAEETFNQSKLTWEMDEEKLLFHKDLIKLRKNDPVLSQRENLKIEGAVLSDDAFLLRYRTNNGERLLLINFGSDLYLDPIPEPLIAPPLKCNWEILWSSEDPLYGGDGHTKLQKSGKWILNGRCALILHPLKN